MSRYKRDMEPEGLGQARVQGWGGVQGTLLSQLHPWGSAALFTVTAPQDPDHPAA